MLPTPGNSGLTCNCVAKVKVARRRDFEITFSWQLCCRSISGVALVINIGLCRWSFCHHNPGSLANARRKSIAHAHSDPGPKPESNSFSNAVSSFGNHFVVAKLYKRCCKLQHLPVNRVFRPLQQNWQRYQHELYRFVRAVWPDLFLYRDFR